MRNIFIVFSVAFGLIVFGNAFAESLQDMNNWIPFFKDERRTMSYEYEKSDPYTLRVFKPDNPVGYLFFYVKFDIADGFRDEMQSFLAETYPDKLKNMRIGEVIVLYRLDCKKEIIEESKSFFFSDKNELILSEDSDDRDEKRKAVYTKDSEIYKLIPFNEKMIEQAKEEANIIEKKEAAIKEKEEVLRRELKKYGAEALVPINKLEANPYEYKGRKIAVIVKFRKMLSSNSASFYSGYTDIEQCTSVTDEIIVTGIPKGTYFESGFFSPSMMLALKGKGTKTGTNVYGAKVEAPYFQWIAIIAGKQPSVFDKQRDGSKKDDTQNKKNAQPSGNQ